MPLRTRIASGIVYCWLTESMIFTFHPGAAWAASMRASRIYSWTASMAEDHHPELPDAPGLIAADDVDAIDVFADGRLELEHGDVAGQNLLRIVKSAVGTVAGLRLGDSSEVHRRSGLAALRGVNDRRVEDDVVRQQTVQHLREFARNDPVPASTTYLITVPPCGRSIQRSALSSVARTGQPQVTVVLARCDYVQQSYYFVLRSIKCEGILCG